MQFTTIPNQFAPLGGALRYAVGHDAQAAITLRIADAADGRLLGAKRFNAVREAAFDAAPYVRSALRFIPSAGPTGVYPAAGRTVTVVVEAAAEEIAGPLSAAVPETAAAPETTASADDGAKPLSAEPLTTLSDRRAAPLSPASAVAPARTFLPSAEAVAAPALLTAFPDVRILPDGASDELTLLTAAAQNVTVIARSGDTTAAASYSVPGPGLHLFRLDARDFPGAETLTVDAGACGTVTYTLVSPTDEGVRLAWRSSAGSVEHYTFPVEAAATVETEKNRAYGPDGHVGAGTHERRRTLRSAFEVRGVLEALAELTSTPEVWLVTAEDYEPVDVVSERAVVHRHGTLNCLEIEIRPRRKTPLPWN